MQTSHEEARSTYADSLEHIPERTELPFVLNARNLLGTGVEVGVQEGKFSVHLLKHWHGTRLICVDSWREQGDDYQDIANVPQQVHELYYRRTLARLLPFGDRTEVWRMTSAEAAGKIVDGSLDFVYLDARHDCESVLEDLHLWYPKIRPGGIFAGHDYLNGRLPQGVFGVKKAVDAFLAEKGLPVFSTRDDTPFVSWISLMSAHETLSASSQRRDKED